VAAASVADVRERARRRLPRLAFDFIDGGADGEVTLRANEAAFARRTLVPRVLVDVARRDLSCSLFGVEHALPLLLAPTGMAKPTPRSPLCPDRLRRPLPPGSCRQPGSCRGRRRRRIARPAFRPT